MREVTTDFGGCGFLRHLSAFKILASCMKVSTVPWPLSHLPTQSSGTFNPGLVVTGTDVKGHYRVGVGGRKAFSELKCTYGFGLLM